MVFWSELVPLIQYRTILKKEDFEIQELVRELMGAQYHNNQKMF